MIMRRGMPDHRGFDFQSMRIRMIDPNFGPSNQGAHIGWQHGQTVANIGIQDGQNVWTLVQDFRPAHDGDTASVESDTNVHVAGIVN